ncbi:hypothetical protein C8D70_1196 [Chryseobacterium sp. CBTAP 102]|uniref:hypothetical protein n=1 Tax=Chryseobacterium sp. CBTAP 102 TaxID=2135644 RepID=UPI000D75E351|nr:hypothetical protein [Chryseobacterium sp. CBTAP 102]PXW08002.1 hypothetical protein C8D70_1196 [Chryseobacterium sp. CBTAP 102]
MKAYYYFLFRIYRYYKDKQNENELQAIFSVITVSTLIASLTIFFFHGLLNYLGILPMYSNKFYMILFMIIVGFINYFFFIRDKNFLNYDFQKDKKGGFYIIVYIILLGILLFVLSNINREKIFEERKKNPQTEQTQKTASLQSEIENWFKEKF